MKVKYFSKSISLSSLCALFILSFLTSEFVTAEDDFWVPKDPPKSHYIIEAKIDVENGIIEGTETIILENTANRPISVVEFVWTINDKSSMEASAAGQSLVLLNTLHDSPTEYPLLYRLPKPLMPHSKVAIDVSFKVSGKFEAGCGEINLHDWHPFIWWDNLEFMSSYQVKLGVPKGYAKAFSGRLNKNSGYYESDNARFFNIYLGKGLQTESREVDEVLITALFTEKGAECARFCLDTAADVVSFFKEWHGYYPYKFLYIIPGNPRIVMGGWPNGTGIVGIHGQEAFETVSKQHWQWITAHEIGHQYWGGYIMDSDRPGWLWIGLGIYADKQYMVSRNLGLEKHEEMMHRYIQAAEVFNDTTIDIPWTMLDRTTYRYGSNINHGKGFSVISALEAVLGEETFQKIYLKCARDFGGKRFGYHDLWRVCEEVTGESLEWFFVQWVQRNRHPCFEIVSRECTSDNGKYISTVKVKRTGTLRMPLDVKAVFEDGNSETKRTSRILETTVLRFESAAKLKEVILDPEGKVARLKKPLQEIPDELAEILWLGPPRDSEKALEVYKNLKYIDNEDNADFYMKLGSALFTGEHYDEAFVCLKKVADFSSHNYWKFIAFVRMGAAQDLLGNRESAVGYYTEALEHDLGGSWDLGFGINAGREWIEERLKTPYVREKE